MFDLDQTLIDDQPRGGDCASCLDPDGFYCELGKGSDISIFIRPHAVELLQFCFNNARGVGIWTRASKEWADVVLSMPAFAPFRDRFEFIWSASHCRRRWIRSGDDYGHLGPPTPTIDKPLAKVWRKARFRDAGWLRCSTLIVDDKPRNFLCNYGNGIRVPAFYAGASDAADDCTLLSLRDFIQTTFNSGGVADVRPPEKRDWWQ